MFLLAGGAITWASQRQLVIALSSTEAEYIALATATQESIWLRRFLSELGCQQIEPTLIQVDNQGAIKLAKNLESNKRTKHIGVKYHFTRMAKEKNEIKLEYIPTDQQKADIFTKSLLKNKHKEMCDFINLKEH